MNHSPMKEIVTVAEMARACGLSRSRFYMLVRDGIMPLPSRNPQTKRPFYGRDQQDQCLLVRRTNCGINGKPILFYSNKWSRESVVAIRPTRPTASPRTSRPRPPRAQVDPLIEELQDGLGQLGMPDVPATKVVMALADEYPDGHANVATSVLLMTVFRRLNRQDSQDNVAR